MTHSFWWNPRYRGHPMGEGGGVRHPTAAQPESASLPGLLAVAGIGCVWMVRVLHSEAVRAFGQTQFGVTLCVL